MASVTIVLPDTAAKTADARVEGDDLWLPTASLAQLTGWELRPEGACMGDCCVPVPAGRENEFVRDGMFNLTALARHIDQGWARDEAGATWSFAEPPPVRTPFWETLEAPDFRLPDLEGREHALSDYRGRKVFLASWASW